MEQEIQIKLKEEAYLFLRKVPPEIRKKFTVAFRKTEQGFKGDWFLKMPGTDNLFEFRVEGNNKWYRILAFWSVKEKSLIIGTHGFEKDQNKTPKKELDKAMSIRKDYNRGGS
jgi:phage-related protein